MLIIKIMHRNLFVITKRVVLRNGTTNWCPVKFKKLTKSLPVSRPINTFKQIIFASKNGKCFSSLLGSPSLGEFLFLNLDIAKFGSNTKTIIKDENSMVMMISDETGEGKMTVHQILPGIMICFTDMHMEQCMSEFELNSGQKVLCIDQCREGRIEMEKIRAIHEQITSNLQVRVTIEELSKQYDMPATSMKKCFREIYGDSIYSYQKR